MNVACRRQKPNKKLPQNIEQISNDVFVSYMTTNLTTAQPSTHTLEYIFKVAFQL